MLKKDNNKKEQELELKDGRTIFKTHNGFRSFVKDSKGKATQISDAYYLKAKKHKV